MDRPLISGGKAIDRHGPGACHRCAAREGRGDGKTYDVQFNSSHEIESSINVRECNYRLQTDSDLVTDLLLRLPAVRIGLSSRVMHVFLVFS